MTTALAGHFATWFRLGTALVLPTLLGMLFLKICTGGHRFRQRPDLYASFAFGIGMAMISLAMLGLGLLDSKFSVAKISLTASGITVAAGLCGALLLAGTTSALRQRPQWSEEPVEPPPPAPFSANAVPVVPSEFPAARSSKIFLCFIALYILCTLAYVFHRALTVPLYSWDAIHAIAFKAKLFFFEEHFPDLNLLPHKSYPLLTPLSLCWVALSLGCWSESLVKIIFPVYLLCLLLMQYRVVTFLTDKATALTGIFLLLGSNLFVFHATIAYRDLILSFYNCTAVFLLVLWAKERDASPLLLSSLFAGFATLVKLEGTAFLVIHVLLVLVVLSRDRSRGWRQMMRIAGWYALPGVVLSLSFQLARLGSGISTGGEGLPEKIGFDFSLAKMALLPNIVEGYLKDLFLSGNWNILWLLFFPSLLRVWPKRRDLGVSLLPLSVLFFLALYGAVALFTNNYIWIAGENRGIGLPRLVLHFFPLAVASIVIVNAPLIRSLLYRNGTGNQS